MLTCILLVQSIWLLIGVIRQKHEIKQTWESVRLDVWKSHIMVEVGHHSCMLAMAHLLIYSYDDSGKHLSTWVYMSTIHLVETNHICGMQDLTCSRSHSDDV